MSETSSQLSPEQFKRLLKEYEICRDEASRLESHIWQTLSILGIASGVGLIRLASGTIGISSYPRLALIASAFAIVVSFVWLRFANRWWSIQHLMFERMREIERNTSFRQSSIVSERDVETMGHIRHLQIRGRWHKRVLNRLRYSIPSDVQPKEASQPRDYEHRGNKPAAKLFVYANVALWLILAIDGISKYTQSDGSLALALFLILAVVAAGLWLWRKP